VTIDVERWSGDGALTQCLLDRLRIAPAIAAVRVEDAPASREEPGYLFVSNELLIVPAVRPGRRRRWMPGWLTPPVAAWAVDDVAAWLAADPDIGPPDFADSGMLQYLRTQRIIPPYQTRGFKLVEMARIYLSRNPPHG